MNTYILKATLVFFTMVMTNAVKAQNTRIVDHVVLISIDGFRPEFYKESKWPVPNIKTFAESGVTANGVRGVFPSVTYPSHTTLITGALPATHGIYYNSPFEYDEPSEKWYWEYNLIKTPTLYDAVKKKGLTSASFIWPVSVGAPVTYNIPEVWTLDRAYGRIEPMRDNETPKGLLAEMETAVLGKMNERTFNGDYLNREDRTGEMAAYVLEEYKPNFMTIHLIASDHFQHEEGREGKKVPFALAAIDRAIGKIKEAAERAGVLDRTTFIITGDHGFVDIHSALKPNVWLSELGIVNADTERKEWKAYFNTSGAAAFLHLKDKNDTKTLAEINAKLAGLPVSIKKLFRVVGQEELQEIGTDPNVVLAINPIPGIAMSGKATGPLLEARSGGTHGYFPDIKQIQTGFVISGAGVASISKQIDVIGLEDIAPLISKLLNLDFAVKDGIYHPGIIVE
ncbi:alkaline phosphatase family protein [Leeuwenhoekiella sp. NPDC079379]|uniref:alkaline phosphatase family protein n=1 Tax=Leeuwenhoekiella sp. NPDC079379 TaxID=3364122 RepID=UPI0037CAA55B